MQIAEQKGIQDQDTAPAMENQLKRQALLTAKCRHLKTVIASNESLQ